MTARMIVETAAGVPRLPAMCCVLLALLLAAPFCVSIFLGCTRLGVGLVDVVNVTLGIRCATCFSTQH